MKKLLLIAGAVCALAFYTASADASHGCRSGYGGGYGGGFGGHGHSSRYYGNGGGHGFHGRSSYYAPQRSYYDYGRSRRGHHHHGPGLHFGSRRFGIGIHF